MKKIDLPTQEAVPTLMIALSDKLKAELIATLESRISFQSAYIVNDGINLFELLNTHKPDYLLIDNELPNSGGFGFLKKLNRLNPSTKVIIYGNTSKPEYLRAFLSSPAVGFIQKSCGIDDFISCLKKIFRGNRIIFSDMCDFQQNSNLEKEKTLKKKSFNLTRLSDREMEVWDLLVQARTEKEIAELLSISTSTVRTHKNKISEKMNIKRKKRLTSFALINN